VAHGPRKKSLNFAIILIWIQIQEFWT